MLESQHLAAEAATTEITSNKPLKSRRTKLALWGVRLLVLALLVWFVLHLKLDPAKVLNDLAHANPFLVALAVILVLPFIALKAWRWQTILNGLGINIEFAAAYRLYAVGLATGSFTPGQAGDAVKAWYLRERGYSLGMGLISIVLDRLFDVAILIMLAASGLAFLGNDFAGELPALLVLLVGTIAALLVLSISSLRDRLLDLAFKFFLRKKLNNANSAASSDENIAAEEKQVYKLNLLPVFALSLVASLLALGRIWLLAVALGINLNPLQVVAVSSLATVVSLLPFSVGGIGFRDVTLTVILGKIGYSADQAISLSSFILLLNIVNLIAGYFIWFTRSNKQKPQ